VIVCFPAGAPNVVYPSVSSPVRSSVFAAAFSFLFVSPCVLLRVSVQVSSFLTAVFRSVLKPSVGPGSGCRLGYFTQSRLPTREQWSVRQRNQLPHFAAGLHSFLSRVKLRSLVLLLKLLAPVHAQVRLRAKGPVLSSPPKFPPCSPHRHSLQDLFLFLFYS
jgi:hypothetical protein